MTNRDQPLDLSLKREQADGRGEQCPVVISSRGEFHLAGSWPGAAAASAYAAAAHSDLRSFAAAPAAATAAVASSLAAQLGSGGSMDHWRSLLQPPLAAQAFGPAASAGAPAAGATAAATMHQAFSSHPPAHSVQQRQPLPRLSPSGLPTSGERQARAVAGAGALESTPYRSALAAESRAQQHRHQQQLQHLQLQLEAYGGLPAHHHGSSAYRISPAPHSSSMAPPSAELPLYEATGREKRAYKPVPEQQALVPASPPNGAAAAAGNSGAWYGGRDSSPMQQLSPGAGLAVHERARLSSRPYASALPPQHHWDLKHSASGAHSHASKRAPPAASVGAPPSPGTAGLVQDLSCKEQQQQRSALASGGGGGSSGTGAVDGGVGRLPMVAHGLDLGRVATSQPAAAGAAHLLRVKHDTHHRLDLPLQQQQHEPRPAPASAHSHSKLSYGHLSSPGGGGGGGGGGSRLLAHDSGSSVPVPYDDMAAYAHSAGVLSPPYRGAPLQPYASDSLPPAQLPSSAVGRCGSAGSAEAAALPAFCRPPGSMAAGSGSRPGAGPLHLALDAGGGSHAASAASAAATAAAVARGSAGARLAGLTSAQRTPLVAAQLLGRQAAAEGASSLHAMRPTMAMHGGSGGGKVDSPLLLLAAPQYGTKAAAADVRHADGGGGSSSRGAELHAATPAAGLLSSGAPMKRDRLQHHHQQQQQHNQQQQPYQSHLPFPVERDLRCRSGNDQPPADAAAAAAAATASVRRWGEAHKRTLPSHDAAADLPLSQHVLSLAVQPPLRDNAATAVPWPASGRPQLPPQPSRVALPLQPPPLSPQSAPVCLTTTTGSASRAGGQRHEPSPVAGSAAAALAHGQPHTTAPASAAGQRGRPMADAAAAAVAAASAASRLDATVGYELISGAGVEPDGVPQCKRGGHSRASAGVASPSSSLPAAGLPYLTAVATHGGARPREGFENTSGGSSRKVVGLAGGGVPAVAAAAASAASTTNMQVKGGGCGLGGLGSSSPGMLALPLPFPSRTAYLTLAAAASAAITSTAAVVCTSAAAVTSATEAYVPSSCGYRAVTTLSTTVSTAARVASKVIPVANVQPFFKNILSEVAASSATTVAASAPAQAVPHKPALHVDEPRAKAAPVLPEAPLYATPAFGGGGAQWQLPLQKPAVVPPGRVEQQQQHDKLLLLVDTQPLLAAACRERDRPSAVASGAITAATADATSQPVPAVLKSIEKLDDDALQPCALPAAAAPVCDHEVATPAMKAALPEVRTSCGTQQQHDRAGSGGDEGSPSQSSSSSNLFKRLSQHQKDYSLHPKKRPYVAECDRAGSSSAAAPAAAAAAAAVAGPCRRGGGTGSARSLYSNSKRKKRSLLDEIANTEGYVAESDRLPDKRRKLRLAARQSFATSLFGPNAFKMTQKRRQQLKAKAAMLDAAAGHGGQPEGPSSMLRAWSAKVTRSVAGYRRRGGCSARLARATDDPKRLRSAVTPVCRSAAALEEPTAAASSVSSSSGCGSQQPPPLATTAADVASLVGSGGSSKSPRAGDDDCEGASSAQSTPALKQPQRRQCTHGLFRSRGRALRAAFGGGGSSSSGGCRGGGSAGGSCRVADRSLSSLRGSRSRRCSDSSPVASRSELRSRVAATAGSAPATASRDHHGVPRAFRAAKMVWAQSLQRSASPPRGGDGEPVAADRCLFEFSSFYLPVYSRTATAAGVSEFVLLQDVMHHSHCLINRDRLAAACGSPSPLSIEALRALASCGGATNAELAHRDDVSDPVEILPYTRNLRRLLGIRTEVVRLDAPLPPADTWLTAAEAWSPPMATGGCSDEPVVPLLRYGSDRLHAAEVVGGSAGESALAAQTEDGDADAGSRKSAATAAPSTAVTACLQAGEGRTGAAAAASGGAAASAAAAVTAGLSSTASQIDKQKLGSSGGGSSSSGLAGSASSCKPLPSMEQQPVFSLPAAGAADVLTLALSYPPHTQPTVTLQRLSRQLLVSCSAEGPSLAPPATAPAAGESAAAELRGGGACSAASSRDCRPSSADGTSAMQADRRGDCLTSPQLLTALLQQQQISVSPLTGSAAPAAVDSSRSRNRKNLTLSLPLSLPLTYCQQHKLTCDGGTHDDAVANRIVDVAAAPVSVVATAAPVQCDVTDDDDEAEWQRPLLLQHQQAPILVAPELDVVALAAAAAGSDQCGSPMQQLENQCAGRSRSSSPTALRSASPAAAASTMPSELPPPAVALLSSAADERSMPTLTPVYTDDKAMSFSHF